MALNLEPIKQRHQREAEWLAILDECANLESHPALQPTDKFAGKVRPIALAAIRSHAEAQLGQTGPGVLAGLLGRLSGVKAAVPSLSTVTHWLLGAAILAGILWASGRKVGPGPQPTPNVIPSDGLRVLVVYEKTEGAPLLTAKQQSELFGAELAGYLNANCTRENSQPAYRFLDKDSPMGNAPKWWQDQMTARGDVVPLLVVTNGKRSYRGPLPDGGILAKIKEVNEGK